MSVDFEVTFKITGIDDTVQGVTDYLEHYISMLGPEHILNMEITVHD